MAATAKKQDARDEAAKLKAQLRLVERSVKIDEARDGVVPFTELTMPDPNDPQDSTKSRYDAQYFHKALGAALEEVEKGEISRLIVTFPPRHGKSELTTRRFPPWFVGRDPYRHIICATYNEDFAKDFGRTVRGIMQSPAYAEIFPNVKLAKGSAAADNLVTTAGGQLSFVGPGGSITGRGGDLLLVDDPIKNSAEAGSATIRNERWTWFNQTLMTRFMTDTGRIIVIQTRWHEDDIVGRITDPTNPHYDAEEAKLWKVINIPALAEEEDVLGREIGEPLWPERFGLAYLESQRRRDPVGFSALYQQRPSPADGDLFQADMFRTYLPNELPTNLRFYAASDHAVGTTQRHDRSCFLVGGIDDAGVIWLVDARWKRYAPEVAVERMIDLMGRYSPVTWWAENGHISKSIGPFLRRRMIERKTFCRIKEVPTTGDKEARAQSIIGRMSMGMVRFPEKAPWYQDAKAELLKFPHGKNDDFVDALAHLGMGLQKLANASKTVAPKSAPRVGTLAWVKRDAEFRRRQERRRRSLGGM